MVELSRVLAKSWASTVPAARSKVGVIREHAPCSEGAHVIITRVPLLDELLHARADALGADLAAYRNHAYRVLNLCTALTSDTSATVAEKIAIATAFHDLGIWTARTLDYLPPSIALARSYLAGARRAEWAEEIDAMILWHHKLTPHRGAPDSLVEPFRRADLVDVTAGGVRFGLPRELVRELYAAFPDAGFHLRLLKLSCARFLRHPLHPLPMFRL
jgi:hypothetical protein